MSSLATNAASIVNLGYFNGWRLVLPSHPNVTKKLFQKAIICRLFTVQSFCGFWRLTNACLYQYICDTCQRKPFYPSWGNSQYQSGSEKEKELPAKHAWIFAPLITLMTFTKARSSKRVWNVDLCNLLQININRWILKCFLVRYYGLAFMRFWKAIIRRRATIARVWLWTQHRNIWYSEMVHLWNIRCKNDKKGKKLVLKL